jgi:transcriptional regulator with XRE-family HTH domain
MLMVSEDYNLGRRLRIWRQAHQMHQKELAHRLGVTQQAVSYWENGRDIPSPKMVTQLRSLMVSPDPLEVEKAFIHNQSSVRALVDVDGIRLVGYSHGYAAVWDDFLQVLGKPVEDKLINELQTFAGSQSLKHQITTNELVMMSGVSLRHLDIDLGPEFKHRLHVCFRRHGQKMYADMVFEPCDQSLETGIDLMLRPDELSG